MTGSVQPIFSGLDACQSLATIVQPLLDSEALLTLVMLVAETPTGATPEILHDLENGMDEVEQLLSLCFRRADHVLRYAERSCAAILCGTESEGALCAIERFRSKLEDWSERMFPLQVGLASAPGEASTLPALLALAMQPRLRIVPAAGGQMSILPVLAEVKQGRPLEIAPLADEVPALRSEDVLIPFPQEPAARAMSQPGALHATSPRLLKAEGAAHRAEMFARARARTLGVPYLPPPHHIPNSVRNLLPLEVMRQLQCLPIGRDRNALTVALADPTDRGALHQLEEITGLAIFPVMTDPEALEALARPARSRRSGQVAAQSTNRSRSRVYER